MKHLLSHLLTLLLLASTANAALTEMRTWQDQQGRTIEAELLRYNASAQIGEFRRSEGMIVKIPLKMLSDADQTFLSSFAQQEPESTGPTGPSQNDTQEAQQSDNYDFSKLSKTRTIGYIKTKEGWEHQAEALMARLSFRGDSEPSSQYVKAYFYDRHKKLIDTYDRPARIQNEDNTYTNPPKGFKKNKKEEVLFPISLYLEERECRKVIVVFGDGEEATAKIYPSGKLEEYAFDERHLIFGKNLQETTTTTATAATEFIISSAKEKKYRNTAWVDGDWSEDNRGILVEVEVRGQLPSDNYFLRAHYFDSENQLIHTQKSPTQIEVDEDANLYTKLPKFADLNEGHEAFFPYDRGVETKDWRKAVIVFGDGQSVDVDIIGGHISNLESLDFPEKSRYSPK